MMIHVPQMLIDHLNECEEQLRLAYKDEPDPEHPGFVKSQLAITPLALTERLNAVANAHRAIGQYVIAWKPEGTKTKQYTSWRDEFPRFDMPQEVLAAVAEFDLLDVSWHNDVCPSFAIGPLPGDEPLYRIWIDHANPELRELNVTGSTRFAISTFYGRQVIGTDDVNELVAKVRELAAEMRGGGR